MSVGQLVLHYLLVGSKWLNSWITFSVKFRSDPPRGKTIMGKGGKAIVERPQVPTRLVTVEEVSKHNKKDDQWIIVNQKAYNVTEFAKRHPGGAKILNHYAGEDATDAWTAFHKDKVKVGKYLRSIYVGDVVDSKPSPVEEDFRKLRELVEKNDWLKTEPTFFILHFLHCLGLEIAAIATLYYFGTGWIPTLVSMVMLCTSQAQWGWTQHDHGHQSVFKDITVSHMFHHLTVGFMKGASSHWWNFRHFQHHAKPNRIKKDPDINIAFLFLLGDYLPVEFGKGKRGFMPYQLQHKYFFFIGPPLLLPIYFLFENFYFIFKRRDYVDFVVCMGFIFRMFYIFGPYYGGWGTLAFYMGMRYILCSLQDFFVCVGAILRMFYVYGHFYGGWGAIAFYFGMRFLESHWFTWVTQMSHLPNDINRDVEDLDWFSLQLKTTCNVEPGPFNDWFTGHLNYQIEHHLFPTMPRVNYYKVRPLVQSICKKHGIEYRDKKLLEAFGDIYRMLKKSGQLWYEAYYE